MPGEMVGQFARDEEMCSRCKIRMALGYVVVCLECYLNALHPETIHRVLVYISAGWRVSTSGCLPRIH